MWDKTGLNSAFTTGTNPVPIVFDGTTDKRTFTPSKSILWMTSTNTKALVTSPVTFKVTATHRTKAIANKSQNFKIKFNADPCESGTLTLATSGKTSSMSFTLGKAGSTTVTTLSYEMVGWNNAGCSPSGYSTTPSTALATLISAAKLT